MNLRKLIVGAGVLGGLAVAYLVYTQIGGTPRMDIDTSAPAPLVEPGAGTPANAATQQVGTIGGVGVGAIQQTRFFHRDEQNRVDREFGFEECLHRQGDRWAFTHPYMKLFLQEFQCHVTADTGQVELESAFGRLIPNDALFEGNVVIHIVPRDPNDPWECFIYLDDVGFVADRSLFSSSGSVRFVSRSALLEGAGLELLYDGLHSRLELFRIMDLESLRLRSADVGLFSEGDEDAGPDAVATAPPRPDADTPAPEPNAPPGDYYECVFHRNVVIDTPQRRVAARDWLAINNIFWPRSEQTPAEPPDAEPSEPNDAEPLPVPGPNALDTSPSKHLPLDAMPEELFDIVVTCDGGFAVTPAGASGALPGFGRTAESAPPDGAAAAADEPSRSQRAVAQRIEYDATTRNTTLVGPVQMTLVLDANDFAGGTAGGTPMPMTITARDAVRYLAASNRVLLEGECVATVEKTEPSLRQVYTLKAPTFALDLVDDPNAPAGGPGVTLRRFEAGGGTVSMLARRHAGTQFLGGTQLLVSRLVYEAAPQLFTGYGPGALWLHNAAPSGARPSDAPTDPNAFSLDQPCYAHLRGFDTLTYASATGRIVLDAQPGPVLISYIPILDGREGDRVKADAGHLELTLRQTQAGRTQLASLVASNGITYLDKARRFAGSILTYDHDTALVTVTGDANQPCSLNDALVDQIEMNVTTREIKTQLQQPSIFQLRR